MNPFNDLVPQQKKASSSVASNNPFGDLTPGYVAPTQNKVAEKPKDGMIKSMAKSIFTAPATIAARPFQAIQGVGQQIVDGPNINKFERDAEASQATSAALAKEFQAIKAAGGDLTDIKRRIAENTANVSQMTSEVAPLLDKRQFSGGIIAEAPENFSDVKKDLGRAAQTVAFGTGAPLAGGALFGVGSSLEQGNDLFSVETAFNTALGGAAGKVLDLVGKPLFNAAGKVIGTITPQTLKDVAAKGAGAISEFAKSHQLLGGIAAKPAEKLASSLQKVDDKVDDLFAGTGTKLKEFVGSQYPGLKKENLQKRFTRIDEENLAKPTTLPETKYKKATEIYKNAQEQGTDLSKVASKNGIRHDSLIEGKNYNTLDTAESLRDDAMKTSHDLIRPALKAAEPGVERVPIDRLRDTLISRVEKLPASRITDAERALMKQRIAETYGKGSPADIAHPNGYSLTDLHDNKIVTSMNGKHKPNGSASDNFSARQSRAESDVFKELLEEYAPPELDIKTFNKAIQEKFQLADYIAELHTKKVPMGITARAIDLFGKVAGASAGAQVGGGLGGVAGYHLGGVLFDAFENLSNPLKARYLNQIAKETPEIFKAFQEYLGKAEVEKLMRLKLPAPGQSSYRDPQSIFYASPKGTVSDIKSEAIDAAARDKGKVKAPKAGPNRLKKIREIGERSDPYIPTKDLPVIRQKNTTKNKRLKDLYGDLPTIR